METKLVNLILGSILHDVGKIMYRSGEAQTHSISGWKFLSEITSFKNNEDLKECVLYHHGRDLATANVKDNSLAYITYIADNISAAGDRRASLIEGAEDEKSKAIFCKYAPLQSVFNILNGNNKKFTYPFRMLDEINFPMDNVGDISAGDYADTVPNSVEIENDSSK